MTEEELRVIRRKKKVRQGQRDVSTATAGALVTIISYFFALPGEVAGAIVTIAVLMAHRVVPDMVERNE